MEKLRIINLGHTEGKIESAVWEFPDYMEKKQPALIIRQPKKDELGFLGEKPLKDLVNVEELGDVDLCRFKIGNSPGMLHLPSCFHIHLIYPTEAMQQLVRTLKAITFKVLKDYGIACVEKNNDIFINIDGKEKKFWGSIKKVFGDWMIVGFSITFEINYELARKIYRLDTEKFQKKGEVKDIQEVICGLWEANKTIKPEEFLTKFVSKLAERLDLEIENDNFTILENQKLNVLAEQFGQKEWVENGQWQE